MKKYHHKESDLQIRCVRYFRIQYPAFACLLEHPQNEGGDRVRGAIAKAEGVQAGVADLMLHLPSRYDYRDDKGISFSVPVIGLAIEMKTKTGRQSPGQKVWQRYFEAAGGHYVVVRDFESFKAVVDEYMANVPMAVKNRILDLHHDIEAEKTEQAKRELQKLINKQ